MVIIQFEKEWDYVTIASPTGSEEVGVRFDGERKRFVITGDFVFGIERPCDKEDDLGKLYTYEYRVDGSTVEVETMKTPDTDPLEMFSIPKKLRERMRRIGRYYDDLHEGWKTLGNKGIRHDVRRPRE